MNGNPHYDYKITLADKLFGGLLLMGVAFYLFVAPYFWWQKAVAERNDLQIQVSELSVELLPPPVQVASNGQAF